jgi:hypothetical protein
MYRGTTPTNVFKTSQDLSDADVVFITYKQRNTTVIEKKKEDITFGTEDDLLTLTVKLTQAETLALDQDARAVSIQIRARYPDGTAIASEVISTSVEEVLKDGII